MNKASTVVFDASSLVAVLLDNDAPPIDVLFDGHVLDLTFYETGNVLWKVHTLQERTTVEEHAQLVSLVDDLRQEIVVHGLDEIGIDTVMRVATETGLTYYDASYLACAEMMDSKLVTEDVELREIGSERVEAYEVRDLGSVM